MTANGLLSIVCHCARSEFTLFTCVGAAAEHTATCVKLGCVSF